MSIGILPNVNSRKRNRDVSSAQSAHSRTGRLKNKQTKPKKGDDKNAVAIVKSAQGTNKHRETCGTRQLSCVSQDAEPDSATISRKGKRVLETIRRVRFMRAALRQANIRTKRKSVARKNTSQTSSSAQSLRHEI